MVEAQVGGDPGLHVVVVPGRVVRVLFVAGRTVVAGVSALVLVLVGLNWYTLRHLDQGIVRTNVFGAPAATQHGGTGQAPVVPALTSDVNILIVGMDSRTDPHGNPLPDSELAMLSAGPNSGEVNTDTMILVHIPAGGQQAVAISFPRDSYVQIAGGYGKHKLNSAFAYARNAEITTLANQGITGPAAQQQADTEGRKNLIATIEDLIGNSLTINRYAEINLVGFYQISQAVGGVQVCLKAPTHDDYTNASFPGGVQTISGVQALSFVRQRHGLPRGDLDRIVRQQVFLGSLANKILSAGSLTNPGTMSALTQAIQNSVTLSSGWDVTSFAEQLQGLTSGAIRFATIPTGDNVMMGADGDVTLLDTAQVQQFVHGLTGTAQDATPSTAPNTLTGPGSAATSAPSTTSAPGTSTTSPTDTPITANGIPCVD